MKVRIWVQMWNVPPHYTSQMGRKLGFALENVLDVGIYQADKGQSFFIKALVKLNLIDTIFDGVMAKNNYNEVFWVKFKYEKMGYV